MNDVKNVCWNCPEVKLIGKVNFESCGQSMLKSGRPDCSTSEARHIAECGRRPELGLFDPTSITFEECPEWATTSQGYVLKE